MSAGARSSRRTFAGWGNTSPSAAEAYQPSSAAAVEALLAEPGQAGTGLIARGLGRSYGDAAQCAGGRVLEMTALDGILDVDLVGGVARVEAGVSLDTLMRLLVPRGWFVPVSPGTRHVTVGGAIAADIHGKNHHRDGSFACHVSELTLATPSGTERVSAQSDPALFWATAGGMGLTGVILEATVSLVAVESAYMRVDTERAVNLDDCMDRMTRRDDEYRYSVAWIDCLARGAKLGRSVLTRGDHARLGDLSDRLSGEPRRFAPATRLAVPFDAPGALLNPASVALFNELWFTKAPRSRVGHVEPIATFFHPLDGVERWNRLYGTRGFVQYQFTVPFGAEDDLRRILETLSRRRVASFLAVLKRFGPADPGPLSFPSPGWTLALDLPLRPGLGVLLDQLDEQVATAGGRVYLAKDSRLRPELLAAMYPRLDDLAEVKARVDPSGILTSDLGRRLGIGRDARVARPAPPEPISVP